MNNTDNLQRNLNPHKAGNGCGSCKTCKRGEISKIIESFPLDIRTRLNELATELKSFTRLCESKSKKGVFSVDDEVYGALVSIQDKVASLQNEANIFPELPEVLGSRLLIHGNALVERAFFD